MDGMKIIGIIGRGGGGSINIDIITAVTLPTLVIQDQIVAITGTLAGSYYMGTNAPTNPIAGDVWIVIGEGQNGLLLTTVSPWLDIRINAANQWNGSAWDSLDAYIGKDGLWVQCASALPPIGTPLAAFTPEQIQRVALGGLATQYFQVGDTHSMPINGVPYDIEIVDFNHDTLALESGNAPITFGMKNCFSTQYRMNTTNTNVGGYTISEMRGTLNNTIYPQISEEWRAIMRPVTKLTSAGNRLATIDTSTETIFLFSEIELTGTYANSAPGEGTHYPKFPTVASRIKMRAGLVVSWWLRSPNLVDATKFCHVITTGGNYAQIASAAEGVAFGFCV